MLLRRSLRTATKALTAQWGHVAPRLFIQLGYIDKDLLESIDIEAQKRRVEEQAHGPRTDPSGGASEPITSGKREAKPTVESQEARAAHKTLKACEKYAVASAARARGATLRVPGLRLKCVRHGLSCARALRS